MTDQKHKKINITSSLSFFSQIVKNLDNLYTYNNLPLATDQEDGQSNNKNNTNSYDSCDSKHVIWIIFIISFGYHTSDSYTRHIVGSILRCVSYVPYERIYDIEKKSINRLEIELLL